MNNYRELHVWNESVAMVTEVYSIVAHFPSTVKFGLADQIKRAAVSIPSKIAEGSGRRSHLEFIRFLSIASGSACELITQLEIARRLNFMNDQDSKNIQTKIETIHKMIYRLQSAIQTNNSKQRRVDSIANQETSQSRSVEKPKTKN